MAKLVFNRCNSTSGFSVSEGSGTISVDTSDYCEQTGAISVANATTNSSGYFSIVYDYGSAVNLTSYKFLGLYTKYPSGPTSMRVGLIDTSNKGRWWVFNATSNVWEYKLFDLEMYTSQDSGFNIASVRYVRVGFIGANNTNYGTMKVDYIAAYDYQWTVGEPLSAQKMNYLWTFQVPTKEIDYDVRIKSSDIVYSLVGVRVSANVYVEGVWIIL